MKYERLTPGVLLSDVIKEYRICVGEPLIGTFGGHDIVELIDRLVELENKIEAGELISTIQDEQSEQEIKFFAKHDVKVCKEVVKECLQVLRDMRVVLGIYDDYLLGWNDGINEAIDRLAKKYCIDEEVPKK